MANGSGEVAAFSLGALAGIVLLVLLLGTSGYCTDNIGGCNTGGGEADDEPSEGCGGTGARGGGGGCGGPGVEPTGTTVEPRPTPIDTEDPPEPDTAGTEETGDSPIDTGGDC